MSAPVEGKIQLPVAGERNVLITSALPYVNNVPHLGNIVGCVLSGDVYARFCRLRGYNTLYICGTDEYGTATETKAQQEGLTPQQICDKYHVIHKAVYDWFDIAFDHFGRTSTPTQTAIAQDIFKKCDANKFICCQKTQQFYCTPCDRFLADRFVSGVCPFCKYEDAKGDQCDKCSKLINAIELTNPLCTVCKAAPQVKDSKQLCLTLPKLQCKLKNFVKQNYGPWSANARQVTDAWLAQKLIARQITRDLKWGTPVPKPGFDSKVFYVWFDAPIGYISITAGYSDQWQKWWKWDRADGAEHKPAADCADTACEECEEPAAGPEAGAEGADDKDAKLYKDCEGCAECDDAAKPEFVDKYNVELVQFLGKDNIPFHSVMFPSTLLAAKDGYIMPRTISSTEYLNYEGAKFSKTRGVGVFGDQARDTGVPSEVWRYYLLANRPEQADTMFTWDDFASKANSELPNNLGNLVQRVLAFISSKLGGVVPAAVSSKLGDAETQLETEVADLMQNYVKLLDTQSLKDALRTAMNISMAGNKYMQDKKPWALTEDAEACGTALAVLTQLIYLLAIILDPFMPGFSRKVFAQLNLTMPTTPLKNIEAGMEGSAWPLAKILAAAAAAAQNPEAAVVPGLIVVPAGHKLGAPAPIFGKLDAGRVTELRQKFQGAVTEATGAPFPMTLVTGVVTEVGEHPTNAKCYVLKVDCGEPEQRQIVSTLVASYSPEALLGKTVLVLTNLKPGKFGGVLSQGMILTALYAEGDKTTIKVLTSAAPKGSKAVPEGSHHEPVKVFDVKSKLNAVQLNTVAGGKIHVGTAPLMIGTHAVEADGGAPEGATVC